jgi:hypothetical protein
MKLMNNKKFRDVMGVNTKKFAKKYSWENTAIKTESILKKRYDI